MATGIELLHYDCDRALVREYEQATGHTVSVRKDRNGWLRLKLDGRKTEVTMLRASQLMHIALAPSSRRV